MNILEYGSSFSSSSTWEIHGAGGWATMVAVLVIILWHLGRLIFSARFRSSSNSTPTSLSASAVNPQFRYLIFLASNSLLSYIVLMGLEFYSTLQTKLLNKQFSSTNLSSRSIFIFRKYGFPPKFTFLLNSINSNSRISSFIQGNGILGSILIFFLEIGDLGKWVSLLNS